MRKYLALVFVLVSVLCLFGCNKTETSLTNNLENKKDIYSDMGTEEIFTTKEVWPDTNLEVEISHVKEVKTDTNSSDMDTWEVKTYVVYPNAKVTVKNADMMLNVDKGKKYPQWAVMLNPDNNERIDIVDNMQPIQLTEDMRYIYHIEGKVAGIYFEMVEQ